MGVQIPPSILLGIYPEMELLLDHIVILFLIFWEITITLSQVAVPFYISISNAQVFQFFHFLNNSLFSGLFFFYLNKCEVVQDNILKANFDWSFASWAPGV